MTRFFPFTRLNLNGTSVATRLRATLIGLTVLSVATTGGFLMYWSWRNNLVSMHALQAEQAEGAAQRINAFVDDLQRKLAYLERVQGLTTLDPAVQQQLLVGLTRHNDAYEYVAIADREGNIVSSVSPYEDIELVSIADTPLFTRVFEQQESYITPVELESHHQHTITTVAVPIRNEQDVIDGVLLARINLALVEFVVDQTEIGQTGYAYVVDERNHLLGTGDQSALRPLDPQLLERLEQVEDNPHRSYLGLRDRPVFGDVHRIPSTQWLVVVELPTAEVYAPLRRMVRTMVAGLLGLTALASGASWLLANSIIRPLQQLTAAATRIRTGNWNTTVPISSSRELGLLATTFNQMTDQMGQLLDQVQEERNFATAILEVAGALVIVLDRQGQIVRFNRACELTLGYNATEVQGKQLWNLFLPEGELTSQRLRYRAATIDPWRKDLDLLSRIRLETTAYQGQWLTASGEARSISWSDPAVLHDDQDEVEYVILTGLDITEREAAELARRESEVQLQAVMNNSPAVIYIKDQDSKFLMTNREFGRLFNVDPETLKGKCDHDIFPKDVADGMVANDRQVMHQDKVIQSEEVAQFGEETKIFLSSKFPLRDEQGKVYGVGGISTDITDRKQAEAQLQDAKEAAETALINFQKAQTQLVQSEKMSGLGQLVAGVAHEINNPVSFIFGNLIHVEEYSQNLIELVNCYQQHYPHAVPEILDLIEEIDLEFVYEDLPKTLTSMKLGADRIKEIVLSLRNFSRLDEDGAKEADIHEGIDNTLMILNNRLKAQPDRPEIQVIKQYGDLPLVECFPGQLNQVVMNLLVNAIDAIEEKQRSLPPEVVKQTVETLTITTTCLDAHRVRITLEDTGPGMTPETQAKLFSPFFTTKPIGQGTGLGLSISHQIITEKHQGQLTCASAVGEGTTFCIDLPIKLSATSQTTEAEPDLAVSSP